jgi:hypothetical protein
MKNLLFILLFNTTFTFAQTDTIRLENPGFEGNPIRGGERGWSITGWADCGSINFPYETSPDIHPQEFWGVRKLAKEGKTYLGLVVRDNETYEGVGQKLPSPLLANQSYEMTLWLAQSGKYISRTRSTGREQNYKSPSFLIMASIDKKCEVKDILYQSPVVDHTEWKQYIIKMSPINDVTHIMFMVFSNEEKPNGHILLDGLSDITLIK